MAVSPGPASTVLRFLRGGCGGDCLCGRLCEPCRGQRGPDFYRGVVDRVLPERVVLRDGRVFRRPGGSAPRPGQDVLVDDRPGLIVQTPQHQPRVGEGLPPVFVPPVPSYDSPQRPGAWGGSGFHVPTTETGLGLPASERYLRFQPALASSRQSPVNPLYLDSGQRFTWPATMYQISQEPDDRALYFQGIETDDPQLSPEWPTHSYRYDVNLPLSPSEWEALGDKNVPTVRRVYVVRQPYGAGIQARELFYQQELPNEVVFFRRPGEILYRLVRTRSMMPDGRVQDYLWLQGLEARVFLSDGQKTADELQPPPDTRSHGYASAQVESVVHEEYTYQDEEGQTRTGIATYGAVWSRDTAILIRPVFRQPNPGESLPPVVENWENEYEAAPVVVTEEGRYDNLYTVKWGNSSQWTPGAPAWNKPAFSADGEQIQVFNVSAGKSGTLNANSRLVAYGHTFTSQQAQNSGRVDSWTVLRDNPRRRTDGTWDFSPLVVLVCSGGEVHAVRPDGSKETVNLSDFETKVLRVKAGQFSYFAGDTATSNSWPAQWAWAVCTVPDDEYAPLNRAIAAHDPWRDSRKHPQADPHPEEWDWKQRPAKRPKTLPASAPRTALGLTLADVVWDYGGNEAGGREAPPLRLPVSATVNGSDVRKAVAKRILYQPANWPEELNDKTSVSGTLSLDFGELPPPGQNERLEAALLIRYRGKEKEIGVNGALTRLHRLGNNAAEEKGWHSYALHVPPSQTYEITHKGRISRALLCVRVIAAPGGVSNE